MFLQLDFFRRSNYHPTMTPYNADEINGFSSEKKALGLNARGFALKKGL
jgi:hypothetical protein